ncbi:hypothetical protein CSQ88_18200 [Iodobacter sp. BJB302]|nr:hypothetical protein CSQ88_18200 [Iodobacter sp. BJB302]
MGFCLNRNCCHLFAIEKYCGFSEAWVRFIRAKQDLEKLKEELDIKWLKLATSESTSLEAVLEELLRISAAKHDILKKETETWATVLQEGVKNTNPSQGAAS